MPIDTSKTVLQVEGNEGYRSLMRRISRGEISAFYQGALATAAAAAFGHFPWFYVYGVLDEALRVPVGVLGKLCRNAFIGFMASAVSDALTNVIRVIKTTKQATASLSSISYMQTIQIILAADGWKGLFGRGLSTRILTNGRCIERKEGKEREKNGRAFKITASFLFRMVPVIMMFIMLTALFPLSFPSSNSPNRLAIHPFHRRLAGPFRVHLLQNHG